MPGFFFDTFTKCYFGQGGYADSVNNIDLIPKMMSKDEIRHRLELFQSVDRNDFYTDGKLDLEKAEKLGRLNQVLGF